MEIQNKIGGADMEQIKILCCEKENEKVDNLNELLSIMKTELEVNIYDSRGFDKN